MNEKISIRLLIKIKEIFLNVEDIRFLLLEDFMKRTIFLLMCI